MMNLKKPGSTCPAIQLGCRSDEPWYASGCPRLEQLCVTRPLKAAAMIKTKSELVALSETLL